MGTKESVASELRAAVQEFVRRFGLLVTKRTPCGEPISPSLAHALMALMDREEAGATTYQHELAQLLGLDRSSVARLCSRLEAEGRLEQSPGADDARSRSLRLTPRGRKMADNLRTASLQRFVRIVEAIPPARRQSLLEALELLTRAVSTLEEEA